MKGPSSQMVEAAAGRLQGVVVRTPVLHSPALDAYTGRTVYLKPENLQHTGSFKFRGAYNRLSQLGTAERAAGVAET